MSGAQASQPRLDRLASRLAGADGNGAAVVEAALAEGGVTPFAGGAAPNGPRRYVLGAGAGIVGGFVPGRHPVARAELVEVDVQLGTAAVPLVLEAARVLVERSKTENLPHRTVRVAFTSGPALRADGPRGLWPSASVAARITLGAQDVRTLLRSAPGSALDSAVVESPVGALRVESVDRLVERVLQLADAPFRSSGRDTTLVGAGEALLQSGLDS